MEHTTSADGTRIAFDRIGDGPPVVLIAGLFCTRGATAPLAEALARRFTVFNVDRRGRGDSGDAPSYAVEREVEDIAAVMEAAGGKTAVYGHSSGAGLALRVAAAGLGVTRVVLHEPPYGADDESSRAEASAMARDIVTAIDEDRREDAIRRFFRDMGLPAEVLDGMATAPDMLAVAPTMPYDMQVMGEAEGGTIPVDLVEEVTVPTLVLAGTDSDEFFRDTAVRLTTMLPDATYEVLEGADHGAPAGIVAPVVTRFLAA